MAAGAWVSRRCRLSLFTALLLAALPVRGQERASRGRGDFGVPLQPFLGAQSANDSPRAEPMRVAYYTARPQPAPVPRAEAVEEQDNVDGETANNILTTRP